MRVGARTGIQKDALGKIVELERRKREILEGTRVLGSSSFGEDEVVEIDSKIAHLRMVFLNQIYMNTRLSEPSIFISYSKNGAKLKKYIEGVVTKKFGKGMKIVSTGFDNTSAPTKIEAIMGSIAESSGFLGVWAAEYPVDSYGSGGQASPGARAWLPSPWMPYELGMAVSMGKPYFLLVEDAVLPEFVLKVAGDTPHIFCESFGVDPRNESFGNAIDKALNGLWYRVVRKLIRSEGARFSPESL